MCWSVDSADTLQSVLLGLGDHWVRPSPSYSYSLLYLVPRHVMMTVKHKPEWWKDTGTCLLQYSSIFQYSSNNSLPDNYCQVVSRSLCLLTLIRVFFNPRTFRTTDCTLYYFYYQGHHFSGATLCPAPEFEWWHLYPITAGSVVFVLSQEVNVWPKTGCKEQTN